MYQCNNVVLNQRYVNCAQASTLYKNEKKIKYDNREVSCVVDMFVYIGGVVVCADDMILFPGCKSLRGGCGCEEVPKRLCRFRRGYVEVPKRFRRGYIGFEEVPKRLCRFRRGCVGFE
jgi:hypothetical protein